MGPTSYVTKEEIIETVWKCPRCGLQNRGREMRCLGCGAPKTDEAKYELPSDALTAAAVTDAQLLVDAKAGLHWVCPYCGGQNRGNEPQCSSCGATVKPEERKASPKDVARRAAPPTPPGVSEGSGSPSAATPPSAPPSRPTGKGRGCLISCLLLLLLGGAWWMLCSERSDTVHIATIHWDHQVRYEHRVLENDTKWEDQIEPEAFDKHCERKLFGHEQVVDHYRTVTKTRSVQVQTGSRRECHTEVENLENGFAKRVERCSDVPVYGSRTEEYQDQEPVYKSVPVYKNQCAYHIYRWRPFKTLTDQGDDHQLRWPELAARDKPGNEELRSQRTATYTVGVVRESDQKHFELKTQSEVEYQRYNSGQRWQAIFTAMGSRLDRLEAKVE